MSRLTRANRLASTGCLYLLPPDGGILFIPLDALPLEKVRRAANFIRLFYPGFQLSLIEQQDGEAAVTMRFPAGAVKFCHEDPPILG